MHLYQFHDRTFIRSVLYCLIAALGITLMRSNGNASASILMVLSSMLLNTFITGLLAMACILSVAEVTTKFMEGYTNKQYNEEQLFYQCAKAHTVYLIVGTAVFTYNMAQQEIFNKLIYIFIITEITALLVFGFLVKKNIKEYPLSKRD